MKRIKHSLEYFVNKSFQNKTSKEEENLLDHFTYTEYQKSDWDDDLMGNPNAAYQKIHDGIQRRISRRKTRNLSFIYKIAASIIILAGLSILYYQSGLTQKQLTLKTASTPKSIRLSDGSKIYLAANSLFRYPAEFKGHEREVYLIEGNAFFEVYKDKKHPFIIHSGDVKTRVLGTSFHIHLSKSKCEVIVVTGKVHVSVKDQCVDLAPNQKALFAGQKLMKLLADKSLMVNWYTANVELNKVTLQQVIMILEYKFNVIFECKNQDVLTAQLSIFIDKDASLESVLEQLNYISNLKFIVNGKKVIVN